VSKIFDILNREKGEIAEAIRPMVDTGNQPVADQAAPVVKQEKNETSPQASTVTEAIRSLRFHLPSPSPLLPFEEGNWRPSEQYRILRTKLVQHPKQPRFIVVSSPESGDGKSVTAINTAGALSLKGEGKVLLLEADLRKSSIPGLLGLPEAPGLTDVLKGACTLEGALVHAQDFPNLYILTAGANVDNPVELLDSTAWQALNTKLRGMFHHVILDSPPVGAVADYDLIQAVCDGIVLVVRPDHTDRRRCQKALDNIPKAKFLGVLLNCVPDWKPARHVGGDHYYYAGEQPYTKVKA
jgi:capsular exopolysaccharide synthesis family protein